MSSGTPENQVDDGVSDEFAAAFAEFSGGKQPIENKEEDPAEDAPPEDEAAAEAPGEGEKPEPAAEPAADAPSEAAPAAETPAAAEEPAADPWAAHPELKALFDAEKKSREEAEHKARSDANRVSALRRQLATRANPAPADEKGKEEASKLTEALAQIEKDYPDIGKVLKQVVEKHEGELTGVKDRVSAVAEMSEVDRIATEEAALSDKHPDWRVIAADPSFAGWASAQTEAIQALATSWDARDVSAALDLYKAERGAAMGAQKADEPKSEPAKEQTPDGAAAATDARRAQQLEGGKDVRSKPAPAASGPPEDFDAAFEYFAKRRAMAR